jgi:hypothetical protein
VPGVRLQLGQACIDEITIASRFTLSIYLSCSSHYFEVNKRKPLLEYIKMLEEENGNKYPDS